MVQEIRFINEKVNLFFLKKLQMKQNFLILTGNHNPN